ncbi:hypothetical protein N5P37_006744 [Trichoderma harzianum]|uniref:Uncharacterized protein n=1 Tax=Trichoderma harzianum CBS 226.95 TaxID=983964 RepID=A0A2T4A302_TRIHA|nr:hypothetical protein M431DRAFT_19423 [Trichoderma harzianum CBS 226.95]KAK0760550.1 hypothetical protein N5P37_006744 [Trichoderma harzianum]PKK48983.1 hypothetical protein CI102_4149 [Trichoderma harzianum]PTB51418.1 hypothetical protein M431DRAFT_19423 [Trichoderma harzianum CBS 226.95]
MRSIFIASIGFSIFNVVSAAQANFYWDFYCQEYAGSVDPAIGQVTGGPYGSRSALWVDADSETSFCTGASAELYVGPEGYSMTQVNIGECEHDDQGIYVVAYCG